MQIIKNKLNINFYEQFSYLACLPEDIINFKKTKPADILLFDIETTGIDYRFTHIYLIGAVCFHDNTGTSIQWFAESPEEELSILKGFLSFCSSYSYLLHYNGNRFDIPYLAKKCHYYQLTETLQKKTSIDLFFYLRPHKHLLKLPNLKQKTLESFLSVNRKDMFDGKDLISVYQAYCADFDSVKRDILLLHNYEDITGLMHILPLLTLCHLKYENLMVNDITENSYHTVDHLPKKELLVTLTSDCHLPFTITLSNDLYYMIRSNNTIKLRIIILEKELKHFFQQYKDYYYLPMEDMAIHKSVAVYADKSNRRKANASNCYVKKKGSFLPQPANGNPADYRLSYKDKQTYFVYDGKFIHNKAQFTEYVKSILRELYGKS